MNKLYAQNKYWGKIDEALDLWNGKLGVDGMMVKETSDLMFIKPNGKLEYDTFKRLGKKQKEYGVNIRFHPYNHQVKTKDDTLWLDFKGVCEAELFARLIGEMDNQIEKYELQPSIDLHLAAIKVPGYSRSRTEKRTIEASINFVKHLEKQNITSEIAFENMPDPGRNGDIELLGYKCEHFNKVIDSSRNMDIGLCIDTGHDSLSKQSITDCYLNDKLYELKSLHFNGTNFEWDSHEIPTENNVKQFDKTKQLIKKAKAVVLEIKNYDYGIETLRGFVDNIKRIC